MVVERSNLMWIINMRCPPGSGLPYCNPPHMATRRGYAMHYEQLPDDDQLYLCWLEEHE